MQLELKQWKMRLPPSLQLHGLIPREKGYRTVIHLHLNYANAWIILCRLPLLFMVRERLKKAFVDPDMSLSKDDNVERLAGSCIEAAQKMVALFETLQQTQSLAKFSFTDFQGCSTATIIMLLHSILDASNQPSPSVTTGLACLRFMASGNEKAKVGVEFVEEFQSLAEEASARIREVSTGSSQTSQDASDVVAYEEWLRRVDPSGGTMEIPQTESTTTGAHSCEAAQAWDDATTAANHHETMPRQYISSVHEPLLPDEIAEGNMAPLEDFQYSNLFPELSSPNMPDLHDSFILGLTGLDTLDFTDQTYWPH